MVLAHHRSLRPYNWPLGNLFTGSTFSAYLRGPPVLIDAASIAVVTSLGLCAPPPWPSARLATAARQRARLVRFWLVLACLRCRAHIASAGDLLTTLRP